LRRLPRAEFISASASHKKIPAQTFDLPAHMGNCSGTHEKNDPAPRMAKLKSLVFSLWLIIFSGAVSSVSAPITLGKPPLPPADVSGLPGRGPHPLFVTGNLTVATTSREQAREFYNAVYTASTGVAIGSSAVTADCFPGANSPTFINATLLRINWFRAMAGLPAAVTFDTGESTDDQAAALMMSGQGELQHVGNWAGWDCFSDEGTNASANSNLALGNDGPDAITSYVWDFGANNYEVGHRRYIIYPQTQIMATGDIPAEGASLASNAAWVFDANYFGSRPATRNPYVAWPPAGYVPYQVVFPQWSFALSNASLSAATVTMSSNGVVVPVTIQPYITGYGENTLVWYPSALDPTSFNTLFPFGGTDTVYTITVSNVVTATATNSFSYNVTVFDPGPTGPGYVPLIVSGTNTPSISVGNRYTCTPASNPNTTGYQWLSAVATNGDLVDNALNGLTNFSLTPTPPPYPIITTASVGGGKCFHLCHTNPVTQILQLNELLFPATNATLSFKSLLGYATSNEVAQVQVSTNMGTGWLNLFSDTGTNGPGETAFTPHAYSLSNYNGGGLLVRFAYLILPNGSYYPETNNYVGWCLENIILTNSEQLLNLTTNTTVSTNFTFTPIQTNNYVLQAQAVIFNQFPLDWGPLKQVAAVVGPAVIDLGAPTISGTQVKIKFTLTSGVAPTFHLLQASQLNGAWTTNGTAVLTTNAAGSLWQFTTTNGPALRFYKVQTP
jgi:hypothetical protein